MTSACSFKRGAAGAGPNSSDMRVAHVSFRVRVTELGQIVSVRASRLCEEILENQNVSYFGPRSFRKPY